jgi:hypothetical protein
MSRNVLQVDLFQSVDVGAPATEIEAKKAELSGALKTFERGLGNDNEVVSVPNLKRLISRGAAY